MKPERPSSKPAFDKHLADRARKYAAIPLVAILPGPHVASGQKPTIPFGDPETQKSRANPEADAAMAILLPGVPTPKRLRREAHFVQCNVIVCI
jgi:hypothetical protein